MSAYISSERLLSSVLEGLSDPAILVEPGRRILASNRAFRSRFSGGADPRGCFCYELTHGRCAPCNEQNGSHCPLDSRGAESVLHHHAHCMGATYEEVFAHPVENAAGNISAHLLITHPLSCSIQLLGRSRAFQRMMEAVHRAASKNSPVLLWGESGSGKMCVARAVHDLSRRSPKSFVVADCAAVSERVLAEELFGSEARAPGSEARRKGLIESANGGTLMLRGVGELSADLARQVIEAIETGTFRHVAGKADLRADVRWVLSADRLGAFTRVRTLAGTKRIGVPPLRRRLEDLEPLIERMIERFGEGHVRTLSPAALRLLKRHSFPGNTRELEGMIERACMLADGTALLPEHFPELNSTIH